MSCAGCNVIVNVITDVVAFDCAGRRWNFIDGREPVSVGGQRDCEFACYRSNCTLSAVLYLFYKRDRSNNFLKVMSLSVTWQQLMNN